VKWRTLKDVAVDVLEEKGRELGRRLVGQVVGSLRVLDVDVTVDTDVSEAPAIFLDLTLPDPPTGSPTWPIDDVLALHDKVDVIAGEMHLDGPWYVRLRPEHEEEVDAEDVATE
jgi:hypothetical protein